METPRFIRYRDLVDKVEISREVLAAIRAHAASTPGQEVCGLLFGSANQVTGVSSAVNVAADPARQFEIDPAALFAAIRREREGGPRLVGYYHSHPGGPAEPSETDQAMAAGDDKLWLIVAGQEVRGWRATRAGFLPVQLSRSWGLPAESVSATRPS
jgi:proteasome lid subunit RPN8/RPN11